MHERVRIFIWMMHHNGLKTKQLLSQRHISEPDCADSIGMEKSMIHALRGCESVRYIWLALVHNSHWETFFTLNVQDWLKLNMQFNISNHEGENWQATRSTTCHTTWK